MRYVWLTFLTLVAGILAVVGWQHFHKPINPALVAPNSALPARTVADSTPVAREDAAPGELPNADRLIDFAMQQLGSPYTYAGTTPSGGFDCSGFLMYVYGHFGVAVPHSTALLIDAGHSVPRQQARRGDMVIFTGTASTSTTPGHAGIIISEPGEPLRFIHSSSARRESGVKISQVEGTDYERRFMGIRRVLDGASNSSDASIAGRKAPAGAVAPVAALTPKTPKVATKLVVAAPKVRSRPIAQSKAKTTIKSKARSAHSTTTKATATAKAKPRVTSSKTGKKPVSKKAVSRKPVAKKPVAPRK
jgi:hypothetical protein